MKLCTLVRDSARPGIVGTFCGWGRNGNASVKVEGRQRYIPRARVERAYRSKLSPKQERQRIDLGLTVAEYKDALR